jgi:hypothetical protein
MGRAQRRSPTYGPDLSLNRLRRDVLAATLLPGLACQRSANAGPNANAELNANARTPNPTRNANAELKLKLNAATRVFAFQIDITNVSKFPQWFRGRERTKRCSPMRKYSDRSEWSACFLNGLAVASRTKRCSPLRE